MKKLGSAKAMGIAVIAIVAMSCAKAPTAEMDAASAAVTRAEEDADARLYAPDSIAAAKEILTRMQAESAAKRFDAAKASAIGATEAADKAIRDGAAAKTRARTDASAAVSDANAALADAKQALAAALKIKRISLDAVAAENEIRGAASSIQSAESDIAKADYRAAATKAQAARSALAAVQKRVSDAATAASRKK